MLKVSIGKIFGGYCGDKEEHVGMMMEHKDKTICIVFNERDCVLPFMGGAIHKIEDVKELRDFLNKIIEGEENG